MARLRRTPIGTISAGAVLSRDAFTSQFQTFLKELEKAAPLKNERELQARIAEGERKIKAAAGKLPAEKIQEALTRLNDLKAELVAVRVKWLVPHAVMHTLHYFLDANERQAWPLTEDGHVVVKLPGIVDIAVEVSRAAIPF